MQLTSGLQRYSPNFQTTTYPQFKGLDGTTALDANKSLLENGPYMGGDMTVQGGSSTATYFVSGGYVDEQGSIQRRLALPDDEAQRRLFGWRRAVQTQEDRFNWSANANVRLDHGPDTNVPLSPVDYAQYGGSLNLGASYRYTPLGAQLPTWVFGRASSGLEDRSLQTDPENKLLGMGVNYLHRLVKNLDLKPLLKKGASNGP